MKLSAFPLAKKSSSSRNGRFALPEKELTSDCRIDKTSRSFPSGLGELEGIKVKSLTTDSFKATLSSSTLLVRMLSS